MEWAPQGGAVEPQTLRHRVASTELHQVGCTRCTRCCTRCTRWVAPGARGAPGVAPGVPGGLHQVHQVGCTKCTRCCTRLDSKISSTEKYPGVTFDIGDETLANPSTCFCGSELCNDAAFSTATSKTLPTTLAFVFLVCAAVILI